MKLFINAFASVVTTIYVATYIFIFSSLVGCNHPDKVDPADETLRGFNNLPYEPVDSDAGAFTVTAGLCKNGLAVDPKNLTADIFTFGLNANPDDAIRQINDTESESEDDDTKEVIEPDQSFPVWTSTTDDGKLITNYQAGKTFLFSVDSNKLVVVRLTDEAGNESFSTFKTDTGSILKTCLRL